MSKEIDVAILDSLLDRIEKDSESGKFRLDGCLSNHEIRALKSARRALAIEHADVPCEALLDQDPQQSGRPATVRDLDLRSLELPDAEDRDIIVCLDFGTAMSKAMAHDAQTDQFLDLAIGQRAGQAFPVYSLASTIYITDSGQVLFGQKAISESTHAGYSGRRRLDSIKDILCKDVVCNLDDAPLEQAYNPTDVRLTKADIVALYLAYLTDMALDDLVLRYGRSRYVRRRFTRPILPTERTVWAEEELKKHLARAQILADTFHGDWDSGLSIQEVASITEKVRNLETLPVFLVDQAITEPVAAVNSRVHHLESNENKRQLMIVVDVGAGTMDIAAFAQIQQPDSPVTYWEVPGSLKVLRQAGDFVDKLLMQRILQHAGISASDSDYSRIGASLSLRIRQYKEDLFREREISYELENDANGVIELDAFLEHESVKQFEKSIQSKFMEALSDIDPSWIELAQPFLPVIFTGGGANLPMVRSVASGQRLIGGKTVDLRGAVATPQWIQDEYPSLEPEYLQLAVAIGGAAPELPQLGPPTANEFGGLKVDRWEIRPAYKGS